MVVPGLQVQPPDEALQCCLQMILYPLQLYCQTCEEGEDVQLPVAAHSHLVVLDGSYSPTLARGILPDSETAGCAWEDQGYSACLPASGHCLSAVTVGVEGAFYFLEIVEKKSECLPPYRKSCSRRPSRAGETPRISEIKSSDSK